MAERHPIYQYPCEYCGEMMTAKRRDKRFCSPSCTAKARWKQTTGAQLAEARKDKTCEYCGSLFTPRRSDTRFCADLCRQRDQRRRNPGDATARSRAWVKANPERRQAHLARFAERHPDNNKRRYARLKADPERYIAAQARTRRYYEENKDKYLERSKAARKRWPTRSYASRHGCDWNELITQLWEAQDGRCYLCGELLNRDDRTAVQLDHDHACCRLNYTCADCRRGLACRRCNNLIGRVGDDPDVLRRIADNLEVAKTLVQQRMRETALNRRGVLFDI